MTTSGARGFKLRYTLPKTPLTSYFEQSQFSYNKLMTN